MHSKFLSIFLCVSSLFNTSPYITNAENISKTNEYTLINYSEQRRDTYHWEKINDKWYYKDDIGLITTGRFMDQYGDIYDTEGNTDGSIIISGTNSLGEFFDHNGRLVNPSMTNHEYYKDLAIRYENGETIIAKDKDDFLKFIEFYTVQYRLNTYSIKHELYGSTDYVSATILNKYQYDRNLAIEKALGKFGPVSGTNETEKIINVCEKLSDMTYDLNYSNAEINTFLDTNRGVCWHYAKAASILLDSSGVKNELIVGSYKGSYHMWLRCHINGRWIYIDPVGYQASGKSFADIDATYYLNNYIIQSTNTLK